MVSDLILETLDTGENTQHLLSLCRKITTSNDEVLKEIITVLARIDLDMQRMFTIFAGVDTKGSPELVKKLNLILQLDQSKAKALREYGARVRICSTVTATIMKLLSQLHDKQKKQGFLFKQDATNLQYLTLSNRLLDTQWKEFKQAQSDMLQQGHQVSLMDMHKGKLRLVDGASDVDDAKEISLKDVYEMKVEPGLLNS